MSEKLKPNFTPIPNLILDEIMPKLAPGAAKVLFGICRYTYGWGKPDGDRISLKQLQDITGMARGSVARSVKELGSLVTVTPGDPRRHLASEYRINIEISDDDLVSLRDQALVSKRDRSSLLASLPGETFQRKSKERRKSGAKAPESSSLRRSRKLSRRTSAADPAPLREFMAWYEAYPKHVGREPARKAWFKINPDRALVGTIMSATARYAESKEGIETTYILNPATWLNQKRWTDDLSAGGNGNGHIKPAEVKELGDGYVEVDGRRMDRRLYERRFANGAN